MKRKQYYICLASTLVMSVIIIALLSQKSAYDIILSCTLGSVMSAIILIDARYFIIPDIISLPMILLGVILSPLFPHEVNQVGSIYLNAIASSIGFMSFYALRFFYQQFRKREGLGLGDVKIAAVAGAWTGLEGLNSVVLLSCSLAFVFIFIRYLSGRKVNASTAFPFGVFIAPSIWIVWMFQSVGFL